MAFQHSYQLNLKQYSIAVQLFVKISFLLMTQSKTEIEIFQLFHLRQNNLSVCTARCVSIALVSSDDIQRPVFADWAKELLPKTILITVGHF